MADQIVTPKGELRVPSVASGIERGAAPGVQRLTTPYRKRTSMPLVYGPGGNVPASLRSGLSPLTGPVGDKISHNPNF
ncbi:hypothetical protein DPMN_127722 [Dreissena polymorpha]|uniref:Uncharacterized protein n=1 Tax=Dreissena polymorpha TaxID=45954 RepID=A0A9D4H2J3_DREPO|nr:hypothetical protein DPMN_127722 [Dreissena polymorpha]